ncbi:phage major capsid protein [Lactococcus garvieae subsp. garvieae]|uniref:phage major capsid protein n=1 Tax=Lactococcus garvieae TaxID=1363 RepID=UPI0005AB6FEC|nr:phage major capsid protein [Lactococcus garvieae]KAA8718815.1 phage major capsid protein [Lactococcus garvieae subsp. garvieae]MDG6191144.1 phage major capsid protein [Lactococcus garvieae]PCS00297.1 phage major head protein [Lactococcus garvieae]QPR48982.1 phage major capsid protein [Lactococcus garvieae]
MGVKLTVNQLNEAWIASGDKVTDYNDQLNMALNDDNFSAEAMTELKNKRDNEKVRRDALKEQLIEAQAEQVVNMRDEERKPLTNKEKNLKDQFISDFKAMIVGDPKVVNLVTSSTDESGNAIGLTIPQDIQTTINTLKRQYDQLEQYVKVEGVSTQTGSRVYEKWSDVTELSDLDDETAVIGDNDDPKLTLIKYAIHRYSGITTATNSLLKDSADNLLAWLSSWIAKKVVVTRNKQIIKAMEAVPSKVTLKTFDDIITMINTAVDPAIKGTSFIMTNTSGMNELALVKNAIGDYLLQPDPKQPDQYLIKGKRIVAISDRWLPSAGTEKAPVYPLYYGDLKEAVTLFDRENLSLLSTNIGGGAFEKDQTKIRVIDRFDVQATDSEAWVAGSFTKIADQSGNLTPPSAPTTSVAESKTK